MDCSTPGFLVLHICWSLLKFMFIESGMPSNHLIFCCPLLLLPSIFPSFRVFGFIYYTFPDIFFRRRIADSLEKSWCWERLRVGGERGNRGWDGWMASLTQWTWVWVNYTVSDGQGSLACCSPWGRKELDTTERLNWTESNINVIGPNYCKNKAKYQIFQ